MSVVLFEQVKFHKIGYSNNSGIFQELDPDNKPLGRVLKMVTHTDKKCHERECKHLCNEFRILKTLHHPYIIKLMNKQFFLNCRQRPEVNFCGIELEEGKTDLLSFISDLHPKLLNLKTICSILQKISRAIQYLHEECNVAHNDIKLENIILVPNPSKTERKGAFNFIPKLADFGFARNVSDQESLEQDRFWKTRNRGNLAPEIVALQQKNKEINDLRKISQKLDAKLGTLASNDSFNQSSKCSKSQENISDLSTNASSQSSPQIAPFDDKFNEDKIDEKKADIFALGVTIFSAIFLKSPIHSGSATRRDPNYQYFYLRNPQQFWDCEGIRKGVEFYKNQQPQENIDSLISLLNGMLEVDPKRRFSISEVLQHPWMQRKC